MDSHIRRHSASIQSDTWNELSPAANAVFDDLFSEALIILSLKTLFKIYLGNLIHDYFRT
jgi:hypothetical protein